MARKRKNGEGTLRHRTDGRWEGRVVIGYDEEGNPKTKSILARTKAECASKLEKLRNAVDPKKPAKVRPDMALGDWLDYWYQNHSKPGLRPTTRQSYENWLYEHLIPGVGHIPLNKVTQSDLQQFFTGMKKNGRHAHVETKGTALSDRSVQSCYAVCRKALDKAVAENLIRANPAQGCKLPPVKGRDMQVLTKEEMQRFLLQAREEGMYELFLLELTTGLRRGAENRQADLPGPGEADRHRTKNKGGDQDHHPAAAHAGGIAGVQGADLLASAVPVQDQTGPAHRPRLCPQAAPGDPGAGGL